AYFPPISQPEGLPLGIQDVKGKEWLFQFRFWLNNNSRMSATSPLKLVCIFPGLPNIVRCMIILCKYTSIHTDY
ncbi:hypothetical protein R6Q59_035792, partial [Mikania micrantha]